MHHQYHLTIIDLVADISHGNEDWFRATEPIADTPTQRLSHIDLLVHVGNFWNLTNHFRYGKAEAQCMYVRICTFPGRPPRPRRRQTFHRNSLPVLSTGTPVGVLEYYSRSTPQYQVLRIVQCTSACQLPVKLKRRKTRSTEGSAHHTSYRQRFAAHLASKRVRVL